MKRILKFISQYLLTEKIFYAANVLILILKICFSIKQNFYTDYFEDWAIARNLYTDHIYSWEITAGSSAYKLPVYPLFLNFCLQIFGLLTAPKAVIVIQHILYFFIPIVVIKIFKTFNRHSAGLIFGYLFILSPAYFYYSNILEATNMFIPIFAVWLLLFSQIWQGRSGLLQIIKFSICTAVLALTQVVAVPIILIFFLAVVYEKKLTLSNAVFIGGLSLLFYSPWIIRNYVVFDKLIISKTPVWQNIYLGYISDYQILPSNKFISEKEKVAVYKKAGLQDEFKNEELYKKETKDIVEKNRMAPLWKGVNNLVSLWFVPKKYFDDNSLKTVIGRKIYVMLVNIFTVISLFCLYRRNKQFVLFSLLIFLFFTVPYLIGHAANIRFKLDFEWLQLMIIALFISNILNRKLNKDFLNS